MKQIMHMVLKYNDNVYSVDTISKHKEVINENNEVIWGVIKPKAESPGISKDKIKQIKDQIESGNDTYAYFATGGHIKAKGKIIDILNNEEVKNKSYLVPSYYRANLDRCISGIVFNSIEDESSEIINEFQRYGTDAGDIALGNQTNPLYISLKKDSENNTVLKELYAETELVHDSFLNNFGARDYLEDIMKHINSKGFIYTYEELSNFYLSLKTKPFVILAGISGTGKSKLVKLFAEAVGATPENNQYNLISVKPDWNDSTELLGYKNLNDEFISGKLTEIIIDASKEENRNKPYFVCLDEMNLARVEYYLSEYLSLIETRSLNENGNVVTDLIFPKSLCLKDELKKLTIPDNLYVIGTVNMDDTTFAFSRKVLDRANTIEFSNVNLELLSFKDANITSYEATNDFLRTRFINIKDALNKDKEFTQNINEKIIEINGILKTGNKHFGYRVRDEIVFYMLENKLSDLLSEEETFDFQIIQKILPMISGSDLSIKDILIKLYNYCNPNNQISNDINYIAEAEKGLDTAIYKRSAEKIIMMLRGYEDGFTSFWL